jgi:serine phosphatase RsbU (regulator of sigma subunit)/CheY-like chemotaxis protein
MSATRKAANKNVELLIAEDSPTQALRLRRALEGYGYLTRVATNGKVALDFLRERPAALVITDIEMPHMNGYELCAAIKADAKLHHTPVILLTSLSDPKDVVEGLSCGADNFLMKPFNLEFLLSRIEFMLANHRQSTPASDGGIEVFFAGEKHRLASVPSLPTAISLLVGTYENAMQKNLELEEAKVALEEQAEKLARANAELEKTSAELREKNAHMQADLQLARAMQQSFILKQHPSFPHHVLPEASALRFCHRYISTTMLGGDFFDVLALSDTTAGVFICDVMGHGVRSALVTAMMRAIVGERTMAANDPGAFLHEINHHLLDILQRTSTPMFASAFYLIMDLTSGELIYANAGHPGPLWLRRMANTVQVLPGAAETAGPALGFMEEAVYEAARCTVEVGDAVVLFTDGLFEAEGADGEYGEERLVSVLRHNLHKPLNPTFDDLLADVRHFTGSSDFEDDVCVIGMEVARLKG